MNNLVSLNNMGIVVESLNETIAFFEEIGLTLEGRMHVAGEWAGKVTGLGDQNVEIEGNLPVYSVYHTFTSVIFTF